MALRPFRSLLICLLALLPSVAFSQETIHVGSEATLRSAISTLPSAPAGTTIVLDTNITLTADLPSVSTSVTIDGGGHTLSGANQFRGLFIEGFNPATPGTTQLATVTIQNLTIANTVASGGTGGNGSAGGGGGAGLGGAIFVGDAAAVTVSNVSVTSSKAIGGNGGNLTPGATAGGGGGGLGGDGGAAVSGGAGGGGGVGRGATGGTVAVTGLPGTLTGALPGGDASQNSGSTGGSNGGGGGGGLGAAGGGNGGGVATGGSGGAGGVGGGGGGSQPTSFSGFTFSGSGGYGGGGGGGDRAGCGGFGGGGGGTTATGGIGIGGCGGQFGGKGADGTTGNGGGGGAGLGGAIFVQGGGTLNFAGGLTINGSTVTGGAGGTGAVNGSAYGSGLYLQGSGTLGFNQSAGQTATISNAIADTQGIVGPCLVIDCSPPGSWGVDKQGAGTLVLTGANIYTGGTTVEAGTLQVNAAQNIGSGSVSLLNGTTLGITGTSTFANNLFLGNSTVSVAAGQQATWNGAITDLSTPGTLAVTGGGTLSLGNTSNSYTGGTVVTGNSAVQISADSNLGASSGAVTLGDTSSAGTLRFASGSAFTTSRSITFGSGGGTLDTAGTANITVASSIAGTGALTKMGTGTLILTAANTYSGGTLVQQGTLRTSIANAFNSLGTMSVASGATLDLNGFNQTVGSISGAGSVTLGNATLTTGGDGTSTVFSGGISGTGSLVKNGAGTLQLTGANSYTGGTILNGGTLLGNTTSLQGNITNNAFVVFSQNTSGAYTGTMSGTGTVGLVGTGTLTLSAGNTYTGGTAVAGGGTISIGADSALGAASGAVSLGDSTTSGSISFQSGSVFSSSRAFTFGAGGGILNTAGTSNITLTGALNGAGGLTKSGSGILTLTGTNSYTGGTLVSGGTLIGTTSSLQGNITNNSIVDFAQGSSGAYAGTMSGTGSLVKDGAGTLQLTGTNSYSGGTIVNGGALVGTTSSLQGNITNNALVVFSQNTNGAYTGAMSGTGTLGLVGTGTLSLNAGNTYAGGTAVSGGGTISIGSDSALGAASGGVALGDATTSGSISFQSGSLFSSGRAFSFGTGGAVLDTAGTSNITLTGTLFGAGALTKTGSGTLTLTGVNFYTGGTTVSGGTLIGTSASLQGNITNNSVVDFAQNTDGAYTGTMSGTGALIKTGSGTLALTGANSYTGGTTVNGGTLLGTTTSLQGSILNNSLVVFAQNGNGAYTGKMSGTGALGFVGSGTLSLSAGNTYTGGTTVTGGGTISIGADSALGAASGGVTLGDATTSGGLTFQPGSVFSSSRSFLFGAGGAIFDTVGASSITLNGALSGAGGLTKTGTGTLTLDGAATYTGPTSILDGALRLGATNVLNPNGALALGSGTSLDLGGFSQTVASLSGSGSLTLGSGTLTTGTDGTSTTFSGAITGGGGLVKVGGGILSLQGSNSYTGGTTVSAGTLLGNTTSLQGNIVNNALVVFDQTPDGTYAGSMSGTGALDKLGAGALALTGTNTYTGGTIINGGSLIGTASSLQGMIVNNAELTMGGATDATFNGVLVGKGNFTKTGTGSLTLNGTTPLTGMFNVNQGTLVVNGAVAGSFNVAPNATLKASGFIAGPVTLAGSLFAFSPSSGSSQQSSAPQHAFGSSATDPNAPPSLVLGGNLTATPGSLIDFAIGPGINPTVQVGGAVSLNGTHFSVTAPSIGSARSESFLALTANGLAMQGADVVTPDPNVVPLLKQDKNALFVTLVNLNVPLTTVAPTGNGGAVAHAIDRVKFGATGDLAFVIHELTALDDAGLTAALEQIGGQIHASALQNAVLDADAFSDMVRNQAAQARDVAEPGKVHFWSQFDCQHANYKGNSSARGGSSDMCGGGGGADRPLSDHFLVGGGGGFGSGRLGLGGLGSSDYHAPRAFGYGGWKPKTFGVRFGGSYAKSSYKTQRPIQFVATLPNDLGGEAITGGVDRQAQSTQQGTSSDSWSEFHDSRKVHTYTIEGLVGVRHARFSRQGWTETGADSLSLSGAADQALTLSETDVKIHAYRRSGTYRPFLELLYRRELTNAQTLTELSFAGAANSNFTIEGLPVPGNTYSGHGGMTMMLRLGQLTAEYSFLTSPNETRQGVGLRFRFK